jgi:hypothetical protein
VLYYSANQTPLLQHNFGTPRCSCLFESRPISFVVTGIAGEGCKQEADRKAYEGLQAVQAGYYSILWIHQQKLNNWTNSPRFFHSNESLFFMPKRYWSRDKGTPHFIPLRFARDLRPRVTPRSPSNFFYS